MEQNIKKIKRSIKIQPLFSAFSDDLIFLVPIDTLFLTITKGLNASQIQFITMISMIVGILSRKVLLNISKKIGNIKSLRLGSFLLLISAVILTFSNQFPIICFYRIIYELAFIFLYMSLIVLKNNLQSIDKGSDYFKIRNKTKIMYSTTTIITSLLSGYLFNLNNYLPMFLQILLCAIMFGMSFLFFEAKVENNAKVQKNNNVKNNLNKITLLIIISFAMSITIIVLGQNNSKLFMQYDIQKILSIEMLTYYMTIIVFISRISRLLGNIIFGKLYKKAKHKINIIVTLFLILAFILLIIGHFLNVDITYKVIIMSMGFFLILATRDSFKVYLEDVALENTSKEEQQKVMVDMEIYRKVFSLIGSAAFTLILIKYELIVIEFILLGMCIIELFINRRLYKSLKKNLPPKR